MNKLKLLLIAVFLIALSLPARVVLAQGTTVEINNGNQVALQVGQSITGSASNGISVAVKGIPAVLNGLSPPVNGLAGFTFNINWNPAVIIVDSAFKNNASGWDTILPGTPNNTAGTLTATGFTTTYSTADVILLYLSITAVGKIGDSTSINVTITSLGDKDGNRIAAAPVNAPVKISAAKLVSLTVTPVNPSIVAGLTSQFTAMGNYDDASVVNLTGLATWTSSNGAIATIQNTGKVNPGLATGQTAGTSTITATFGTSSATTTLTVTKSEEKPVTSPPGQTAVPSTPPPPVSQPGTVSPTGETQTTGVPTTAPSGTTTPAAETKTTNAPLTAPGVPPGPPPAPAGTMNWLLLGSIGAGVVIIGLVLFLLLKRQS